MIAKKQIWKKVISVVLTFALLVSYIPFAAVRVSAAEVSTYSKIVDKSTMDTWTNYFGKTQMHTTNAGGVWTDKSVFTDASAFPTGVQDKLKLENQDNSFLVALSAIAANKEIVGYATIPTDTVLVLDVSGSMEGNEDELVMAANLAIDKLLKENNNNRVGVVLYSGSNSFGASDYDDGTVTLLPINRYTASNSKTVNTGTQWRPNNITVPQYITLDGNTVEIDSGVSPKVTNAKSKNVSGGTYIQAGLWEAYQLFNNADTTIGQDNFQSGQSRMPILVLMSDGAPTSATTDYANVGDANVGNGSSDYSATNGTGFLTQLTASYVFNRIKAKYKAEADTEGKGLFYTLGFGDDFADAGTSVAESVLNPSNSTSGINSYWNTYLGMSNTASMQVTVPRTNAGTQNNRNPGTKNVFISKNAYVITQDYVTEFHSASNTSEMIAAFEDIVDEILIQSRYYPTHLEGNTADFGGYVTFEDKIGEYMEVKNIKGILLGEHLFTGQMMASKLNDNTEDGLGTPENPTKLGDEFIRAVKSRLGITDNETAHKLVEKAFSEEYKQLYYNAKTGEYSNYIGWYAYADGSFAGFYHQGKTSPSEYETDNKKVVYANKSYGFLGEATGSIKDSDMMYMSVQVHTNIQTGEQSLIWKIPAALVPMVTYLVTLKGTSVENATEVNVSVEDESTSPIRLLFEVGLHSDINELNVAQKVTEEKHIDSVTGARKFWSNHFYNPESVPHEQHVTTVAGFTPSLENERYYYTTDTPVLQKVGDKYVEITDANHNIDINGEYYHARYVFKEGVDTAVPYYERISKETLQIVKDKGWDADYDNGANASKGAWIVPINTVYRELSEFRIHKTENEDGTYGETDSVHFATYRYVTATNASYEIDQKHGNNGLLTVLPAQGIKLSKTVENTEPGTEDNTFKFRITLKNADGSPFNGTVKTLTTALDSTEGTLVDTEVNGSYTVEIKANQTFYMTELPTGTTYTIEEITQDDIYKVKTVHVNAFAIAGTIAAGTVQSQKIDDVDFLNTTKTHGNLIISKELYDENGKAASSDTEFTAEVTLTNSATKVDGTYETQTVNGTGSITVANGKFRVNLKAGESISIHKLPEETAYTVTEITPPSGFAQDTAASQGLTGTITEETNATAKIVNIYKPTATNLNGEVVITKTLSGRDWKTDEKYEFKVEMISPEHKTLTTLEVGAVTQDKKVIYDLSGEQFKSAGVYQFRITETVETVGGMTYDSALRRFDVTVEDVGMNGSLDIVSVTNVLNTTVAENAGKYTVSANFNNVYAPTTVYELTIPVIKEMEEDNFGLNGFQFGLFENETDTEPVDKSTLTDVDGNAYFTLGFSASLLNDADNSTSITEKTYTYYIKELGGSIPGMNYAANAYKVVISFTDNLDGTVTPSYKLYDVATDAEVETASFINDYTPTAAVVVLSGKKVLKGNRVQNAGEFEFNLYETDSTYNIEGKTAIQNKTNAFDGSFIFDYVTLEEAKDYYFVVTETKGSLGGIIYDNAVYQIKVTVTDDNGTLKASAPVYTVDKDPADSTAAENASAIVFTNEYKPTSAKVQFTATKFLDGKNIRDNEFTFLIKNEKGEILNRAYNVGTSVVFDEIEYTEAGTHKYTISEAIPSDVGNYDYDKSVYDITVTVTDDGEGTLTAHIEITKSNLPSTQMVFRNAYVSEPVDLTTQLDLEGKKTLEGRTLHEGEFEFKLENVHAGTTLATVKNDANGNFKFENITVKAIGEYHYRISEIAETLGGVTYDSTAYDITFKVVKDMDSGELNIENITVNGGTTIGDYNFKNTYKAAPANLVIKGTKEITGRDLEDKEFTFKLYNAKLEGNKYVPDGDAISEKTNNVLDTDKSKGEFTFDAVEIPSADTYHYVVVEDSTVNKKEGVTYDANVFHITVTATDKLDGTLELVTTYDVDGTAKEGVAFSNTYKATKTELLLQGVKTITNRDLADNEFTFNLYETDSSFNIEGKTAIDTTTNAGDGKFAFKSIDITEVGEGKRYFVVTEDSSAKADGVTYDDAIFKVTVTITDDKNGQLHIEKDIVSTKNADQKDILFANLFTPAPTEFNVNVKKKLVNETEEQMGLDGFKFSLKGDKDTDLTAETDAEGNASFTLKFTADDIGKTYTYKVTEIDTEIEGMVYSTDEFTIKVTVSVDNNGNLLVNLEDNPVPVDTLIVEFTNTYKGVPPKEEEPPKQDPPKQDPPKQDPPKEENPPVTGEDLPIWSILAVLFLGAVVITTSRRKEMEVK